MPTESQLRDTALRLRVRERIENGRLPAMAPSWIAGGYGAGRVCAACDEPITSTQVEYEVNQERGEQIVWQTRRFGNAGLHQE